MDGSRGAGPGAPQSAEPEPANLQDAAIAYGDAVRALKAAQRATAAAEREVAERQAEQVAADVKAKRLLRVLDRFAENTIALPAVQS